MTITKEEFLDQTKFRAVYNYAREINKLVIISKDQAYKAFTTFGEQIYKVLTSYWAREI